MSTTLDDRPVESEPTGDSRPGGPASAPPTRPNHPRGQLDRPDADHRSLWSLIPVTLAALSVGWAFGRTFETRDLVPVILPSAIVPVLLSVACSRPVRAPSGTAAWTGAAGAARRGPAVRPLWPSLIITVVCWSLVLSATLFRDRAAGGFLPSIGLIREIWSALLDAPHAVLSVVAPVPGDAEMLVLPATCVWLAALGGAELALRTRTVVAPAVPAVLLFAVPAVLGTGGPGSNVAASVALAGSVGLLLVSRRPGRGSGLRNLSIGLPLVVASSVFAGAVGPALPGATAREAPDLHTLVEPPTDVRLGGASPLDRISAWLQTPERPLFTVAGPAPAERNWRLAVFDSYNGVRWAPADDLRTTTGRVPDREDTSVVSKTAESHLVTIKELGGIWLPAADRPREIRPPAGLEISVEQHSGTVAAHRRLPAGTRYEVDSRVPVLDPNRLQFLPVGTDPAFITMPDKDVTGEPFEALPVFRRFAEEATAGASFPYQQALRLASWLRTNYRYDITATPGHSYRNLQFFLESGKIGTSEQFATAFAVMARTLNLPSRVVVGFSSGTDIGGGVREVRAGDVVAWPEIEFAGAGWVPFFPTPGRQNEPGDRNKAPGQDVAQPGTVASPPPPQLTRDQVDAGIEGTDRSGVAPDPHEREDKDSGIPWWLVAAVIAAVVLLGYAVLVFIAPRVERRRRRGGTPNERVLGAWQLIGAALTRAGLPAGSAATAQEVAVYGGALLPAEVGARLPALADLVNDCAYGERVATQQEADDAWSLCAALEGVLRRESSTTSRRRRVLARWRPRRVIGVFGLSKGRREWGQ
ncbi:DUF3488 and transglutaminase-like domain-containing protein [Embleya sp. NBC_00888]|uniref:transglutaminase family protein n=1 Tax=Embleya sp. NBC_00888 TaxID=2975960 RepID=UPI003870B4FE|nr:DUF3488 and transglutaminase-like domain-containing protein [Embleya sp. NBC_00888]